MPVHGPTRPPAIAITGRTHVYGVLGDPVSHSLSPVFWNAALRAVGLDAVYVPFAVPAGRLPTALAGLQALGVRGVNVTLPYKEAAAAACTVLEPPAAEIGAVNTLRFDADGAIHGSNTDALGMVDLLSTFDDPPGKVVLLGAGGAAKAVLWSLFQAGATMVYWSNRTASRLVSPWDSERTRVRPVPWASESLKDAMVDSTLIINATSLGWGAEDHLPWLAQGLGPRQRYLDLTYNPSSPLLRDARASGARVTDGLDLLVRQGAAAFTRLTGQPAPLAVMRRALRRHLMGVQAASPGATLQSRGSSAQPARRRQ